MAPRLPLLKALPSCQGQGSIAGCSARCPSAGGAHGWGLKGELGCCSPGHPRSAICEGYMAASFYMANYLLAAKSYERFVTKGVTAWQTSIEAYDVPGDMLHMRLFLQGEKNDCPILFVVTLICAEPFHVPSCLHR